MEHFERMGLKREGNARSVDHTGMLNDFFKYRLVAKMHAVEVPEGQHRLRKTFCNIFEATDNSHMRRDNLTLTQNCQLPVFAYRIGKP